jgi:hypothetical protein
VSSILESAAAARGQEMVVVVEVVDGDLECSEN